MSRRREIRSPRNALPDRWSPDTPRLIDMPVYEARYAIAAKRQFVLNWDLNKYYDGSMSRVFGKLNRSISGQWKRNKHIPVYEPKKASKIFVHQLLPYAIAEQSMDIASSEREDTMKEIINDLFSRLKVNRERQEDLMQVSLKLGELAVEPIHLSPFSPSQQRARQKSAVVAYPYGWQGSKTSSAPVQSEGTLLLAQEAAIFESTLSHYGITGAVLDPAVVLAHNNGPVRDSDVHSIRRGIVKDERIPEISGYIAGLEVSLIKVLGSETKTIEPVYQLAA